MPTEAAINDGEQPKLQWLEVGRATAALLVVLHHADQATAHFSADGPPRYFLWAHHGVDFFFVLSGFIIYHVHGDDARTAINALSYAMKRVSRIYVPYLPVACATMLLYVIFENVPPDGRRWNVLSTLTLLPFEKQSVLSVAWTLTYEIIFYAFFLTFYLGRIFVLLLLAWCSCILAAQLSGIDLQTLPKFASVILNPLVLLFFGGLAAAMAARMMPGWFWRPALAIAAVTLRSPRPAAWHF